MEHHRLALAPGDLALVEKRLFGDPLVVQARVVLDHAGRVIKADSLRKLAGILGGSLIGNKGESGSKLTGEA